MEKNRLWYPYAQMKTMKEPYHIESAKGVCLKSSDGKELIDSISSWWCMLHGYNNEELNNALKDQIDKFSHIMLGGISHDIAMKFADKLVEISPKGLNHAFFSDSGSVAVEVALKMAIQYYYNLGKSEKVKVLSLEKSYHGDTFKTMAIGDDPDYHGAFSKLFKDVIHAPAPSLGFSMDEKIVLEDIEKLEKIIIKNHREIACFILEPLLQAGGGMNFYSPLYLEKAKVLCEKYDILFLFDEVATGFGRTGKLFAADYLNFSPDIMILGKALTAGYIGHAVTLASSKVFEAFYDDDEEKAFMHGPTFMANPLACAVGLKSIEIFERENYIEKIEKINKILCEGLLGIKSELVKDVRVLGACGVIEVYDSKVLENLQSFAYERGVWMRPFLNFAYTMPPYIIDEKELNKIIETLQEYFT